ncbi:MAG: polyketide cyclase [Polyangiaceae bacterium]|nr:polyketide cyclase [Polyangiaceae bacterium]
MTIRSAHHATFVVDRTFPASPARVFAAFSDPVAKAKWFEGPPDWTPIGRSMDFRVGGKEHSSGRSPDGLEFGFDCTYYDIVPEKRIVYAYEMYMNNARISVSVATIELTATSEGTRMVVTEQGAYLDGKDTPAQREAGTHALFDKLAASLAR